MDILKRYGTKTVQYQIDIILNKLYMNVNVPGCEISVILKRGDHKAETKIPVSLKDKIAKFNKQQITVPTKLYWDEKKKEFLAKNAELQINIIHQKKVRCAGKIEFDVGAYATKGIKSNMEQRQLQKCPDSSAKLLYEIRVHEFGDYSYYKNREEDDDEPRSKAKTTTTSNNARGRDVSPMIDMSGNTSARGQIQNIDQFNERSKSPITTKVDQSSKTVSFGRNQEYQSNYNPQNSARGMQSQQDESQLKQNLFSQSNNRNNDQSSKYATTTPTYSNGQYNSQPTNGLNGDYNAPKSARENYQANNNSSNNNLSGSQKQQELINQNQMRDLFKQQKEDINNLNQKIQKLTTENDSYKQQVDTLKNENQRLKGKIGNLESQNGSQNTLGTDSIKRAHQQEIQSYEEQIKKLYEDIKVLKQQSMNQNTEELEKQIKSLSNEQELNLSEVTLKYEREKTIYEKKMKDLQLTIEEMNVKLNENQNDLQKKQKDVEYYKGLVNRSNKEETDNEHMLNLQKQVQELSAKNSSMEKEYKQKIKDLQDENQKIKKDKELEVIDLRRTKAESDHELSKLSRENDQLKKDQKDIQTKYNQAKSALQQYLNKEGTEVSSKSKELQTKYDELNNTLKKVSVERGNIEMERDNLKSFIKQKDEDINKLKFQITALENRLKNTKENLCEMLNVVLMTGDRDLIDEVEPYLNEPEEPEYVPPQNPIVASLNQQYNNTSSPNTLYTPTPFNFNNQFTNNLVSSEAKTNELYKSNNFSDKNFF